MPLGACPTLSDLHHISPFLRASSLINGQEFSSFPVPWFPHFPPLRPCRLRCWSATCGPPELQHIVGRTDQRPFTADLAIAPQQELSEPTSLLDLTEDQLDRDLAFGVQAPPALRAQRAAHAVRDREFHGNPAMLLPLREDQEHAAQGGEGMTEPKHLDEQPAEHRQMLLTEIADGPASSDKIWRSILLYGESKWVRCLSKRIQFRWNSEK